MFTSLVAVFAAVFALIAVGLCAFGVIPPNRLIGLRTRVSLRSRQAWQTVHRRAIAPLVVTSVLVAACWLLYPSGIITSVASAGIGLMILVAGLMWGWARGTQGIQDP